MSEPQLVQSRLPVSVIVLTFNEESNIQSCLESLEGWAGEIFIVDSGSTDATLQIARRYTDRIVTHPFDNYAKQRNWAQDRLPITFDWVFHIDADERVTPALVAALRAFFAADGGSRADGLLVRRRIEFWGRHIRHGGIYPTYHCRVFRRGVGSCEDREYDQHFIVRGTAKRLEADLTEVTASSLREWTARHNRWAQMEATHLHRCPSTSCSAPGRLSGTPVERRRWLRASIYERSPLFARATAYFLLRYVLRGGFLDGMPGLVYHVLHGFWFRFYVDACLYEMKRRAPEDHGARVTAPVASD